MVMRRRVMTHHQRGSATAGPLMRQQPVARPTTAIQQEFQRAGGQHTHGHLTARSLATPANPQRSRSVAAKMDMMRMRASERSAVVRGAIDRQISTRPALREQSHPTAPMPAPERASVFDQYEAKHTPAIADRAKAAETGKPSVFDQPGHARAPERSRERGMEMGE